MIANDLQINTDKIKAPYADKTQAANIALATWRSDKYILSFLFINRLQFQPTNNAEQQIKQ